MSRRRQGCIGREGKGPQRRPQERLDRRLEEVAEAVWGGYCRLHVPLKLALGVRGTVAGRRLGALEGGGPPPLPMHPCSAGQPHQREGAHNKRSGNGQDQERTLIELPRGRGCTGKAGGGLGCVFVEVRPRAAIAGAMRDPRNAPAQPECCIGCPPPLCSGAGCRREFETCTIECRLWAVGEEGGIT